MTCRPAPQPLCCFFLTFAKSEVDDRFAAHRQPELQHRPLLAWSRIAGRRDDTSRYIFSNESVLLLCYFL
jgi:hypothetical protein